MSKTHNQIKESWEVLIAKHSGNAYLPILSSDDSRTFVFSIVANMSIVSERFESSFGSRFHDAVFRSASLLLQTRDLVTVACIFKEFKTAFLMLDDYADLRLFLRDFKHLNAPELNPEIFTPLKIAFHVGLGVKTPMIVSLVLQFCDGWARVNSDSLDYTQNSLNEYCSLENDYPTFDLQLAQQLQKDLHDLIEEYALPSLGPSLMRHGPGAVAQYGKISRFEKQMHARVDQLLEYCFPGWFPFSFEGDLDRTSQLLFVPKSLLTWRTISMEPIALMMAQQAVKSTFYRWFEEHPRLRHSIQLRNASCNTDAARAGSLDHSYATIDLSSASDYVSWDLVKMLFRQTPYLRLIWSTRSLHTELPDGSKIRLKKFAPMGSALCFPIETLVFYLISARACKMVGVDPKELWIYGDDIVCPERAYAQVVQLLTALSFKVNATKTFSSPYNSFRESCGGEFFQGIDVTPIRFPRNFRIVPKKTLHHHPQLYAQWIACVNRLFHRGLRITRALLLNRLLCEPKPVRPLFIEYNGTGTIERSDAVYSVTPTNHHLNWKVNDVYQGYDLQHGALRVQHKKFCESHKNPMHSSTMKEETLRVYSFRDPDHTNLLNEDGTVDWRLGATKVVPCISTLT